MNRYRLRLLMLAVVIIGGFFVLFYRLWFLQIQNQEEYINKQPVTATAKQRVPGTRGRILDRNRVEFARNETNMQVAIDLAAVEAAWKEKERAKPRKERRDLPVFPNGPRKEEVTDIIALLNETVFPELNRLKLYRVPASEAEKEKQKRAIITSYISNKGVIPYTYEKNLLQADEESFRRFTAYAENAPSIPGLTITERPKRRYPLRAMAGHLIGYIRENRDVLSSEEKKAMDKDWEENRIRWHVEADDIGVAGLEQAMDEKLRPKPGERIWLKNEHGRLTDEIESLRRDPLPGADVFLTLDAGIQMITEMALRDAGVGRGAAVVMDPNTGEILAMASVPSYDPSIFIPPQDVPAIEGLDDKNDPYGSSQVRALARDLPGSTFKLVTAMAGSIAGLGDKHYNCPGIIMYGNAAMKCWTVQKNTSAHGSLVLPDAIKGSCNCFFYQMGNAAKIDRITEVAALFGFGELDAPGSSGLELPSAERNGIIASRRWWTQETGRAPSAAEVANISIGQGKVSATPLQMCMVACAVANGGKIYEPTLINHFEEWQYDRNGQRQKVISDFNPRLRADLVKKGVNARDLDAMREGMFRVVNAERGGTGRAARSEMVKIAGKTGTAQRTRANPEGGPAIKDNNTWFISFAPFEDPKLAVTIYVQNGEAGGKVSAPIARRIIEQTLAMRAGNYNPHLRALEPAKGHFDKLEKPAFEGDNVPLPEPADDPLPGEEESTDSTEAAAAPVEAASAPKPAPPKAVIVEEDDSKTMTRQILEPVKFRLKTDPPNPPASPRTASRH